MHAKSPGDAGGSLPYPAIADDAHRLACQLDQRVVPETEILMAGPPSLLHCIAVMLHMVSDLQQQGKRKLCHRIGTIGRDVGHHHAPLTGSIDIHHVITGCQHPDVLQVGSLGNRICIKGCLVGDDDIGRPNACENLLLFGPVVDGHIAEGLKTFPTQVPGVQGIAVKNHDGVLHRNSSSSSRGTPSVARMSTPVFPYSRIRHTSLSEESKANCFPASTTS
ncbi:hypothetical protein SDC9_143254 [bioreactor metagenome]|uniref:Uncharacterized protein n=1 Tax=bioreactor metagenome TaxID=1076179 RepID=A0A645E319_9ZZZZ